MSYLLALIWQINPPSFKNLICCLRFDSIGLELPNRLTNGIDSCFGF